MTGRTPEERLKALEGREGAKAQRDRDKAVDDWIAAQGVKVADERDARDYLTSAAEPDDEAFRRAIDLDADKVRAARVSYSDWQAPAPSRPGKPDADRDDPTPDTAPNAIVINGQGIEGLQYRRDGRTRPGEVIRRVRNTKGRMTRPKGVPAQIHEYQQSIANYVEQGRRQNRRWQLDNMAITNDPDESGMGERPTCANDGCDKPAEKTRGTWRRLCAACRKKK